MNRDYDIRDVMDWLEKGWNAGEKIIKVVFFRTLHFLIYSVIMCYPFMMMWNFIVPDLTKFNEINPTQAIAINMFLFALSLPFKDLKNICETEG